MKNSYKIVEGIVYIDLLSKGQVYICTIDEEDLPKVQIGNRSWFLNGGYARTHDGIWMHNLILPQGKGKKTLPDHKDNNRLNNCKYNLRRTTNNNRNALIRKDNVTGIKGVQPYGERYRVRITVNKQTKLIGYFNDKYEAGRARVRAEMQYFQSCEVQRTPIRLNAPN